MALASSLMTIRRPHLAALAALALCTAVLAGCSDDDGSDDGAAPARESSSRTTDTTAETPLDTPTEDVEPAVDGTDGTDGTDDTDGTGGSVCTALTPERVAEATDGLFTEFSLDEPGLVSTERCQFYDADLTTFAVVTTWPLETPDAWGPLSERAVAVVLEPQDLDPGLGEGSYLTSGTGVTGGPVVEAGFTDGTTGWTVSYSTYGDATPEEAVATTRTVLDLVADVT